MIHWPDIQETWRLLPTPPDAYRYVFAKDGRSCSGTWVASAQALGRWATRFDHANCYIQLNPAGRADLTRPTAKDVTYLQGVLIDVDPVDPEPNIDPACRQVDLILRAEGFNPLWLMTGRGQQAWILFDPVPMTDELRWGVKGFVNFVSATFGIAYGCVVDTTCSDPARLARLPGTVNQKTGVHASLLLRARGPNDPFKLIQYTQEEKSFVRPPSGIRATWPQAAGYLTNTAREFIMFGVEQTRRHKCCYATARSLMEAGVPEPVATGWLLKGAERCEPELEPGEVLRIARRVYEGQEATDR